VSKNTHIKMLGLALCAVFVLGAYAATSAFAVDEWLFNGNTFAGELPTDTEGELTLDVLNAAGVLINEIDCSSLFEGTVLGGVGGIDLVVDIYSLPPAQVLIEELPGTSLSCQTLFDNEACRLSTEAGSETLLWVDELSLALGLTWESLIELDSGGTIFLDRFHHVAFELLCVLLNGAILESLCEGTTSGVLTNVVGGVLIEVGEAAGSESLICTNKVGEVEVEKTTTDFVGDLIIKHAGGGTLTVS
jgi:hypothetical protein